MQYFDSKAPAEMDRLRGELVRMATQFNSPPIDTYNVRRLQRTATAICLSLLMISVALFKTLLNDASSTPLTFLQGRSLLIAFSVTSDRLRV